MSSCTHNTILLGDFNLPNVDWIHCSAPTNQFYDTFLKFINNFGLHQFVLVPTRIASHGNGILAVYSILYIFTNMYNLISDLQVLCPFSTSDQNMLKFNVNLPNACNLDARVDEFYYDYKNADYSLLIVSICQVSTG